MKIYLQEGDKFDYVAGGDVASGDFIIAGALCGVAENGGAANDHITVVREGVFELAKAAGTAWAQGDRLFWDSNAKNFTTDDTKTAIKAVAFAAALSADTTGYVLLDEAGALKTVAGQATTATASDTIVTGLSKVVSVIAGLDDDPGDDPMLVSASIGDQAGAPAAGSFLLKTWKNTGGTDPTPVAASTFGKKVNWIAVGV
jgi:predicted RecA/RadA family phage recombinase